ncbi:MAG TPA: Ig-like domain-containing protein [Nocardioides sp.]|uniref:Ig-like domain-containing protein n=1 Tax=Nocardioides sp. TaxID=35761 RepID=UPI002E35D675|nr:Ig-like domain-containing protein [Nocardioides sp.]HEX5090456.1 Ig-like domain-containing protein [Nocardioides sp.]
MRQTRVLGVLAATVVGALLVVPPATAASDTTTTLTSSANPSLAGQAVTLTATVTGDSPTGQVVFGEPGTTLGVADLTSGVATLVVSSLGVGSHVITATYNGDASNNYSYGDLTQTVAAPPAPPVKAPEVKLAASTTKASVGDKVVLRWRSKNADSLTASGDWSGAQKPKGSKAVRISERGKHVFKLTVQNAAGSKTATVTVMAARKAKTLELVVTDELTMVGSEVTITADGLAKAEEYTIRLDGKPVLTGKANGKGDVARTLVLAKTLPEGPLPLTITGSNPGRLGTAILNVIKAKQLDVRVADAETNKTADQTVTVTGLAAGETVTVFYLGKKLTTGAADANGKFTYVFNVGKKKGQHKVKVVGADPSRTGTATFTVLDQVGGGSGGGGGGGGEQPPPQL